MFQTKGRIVLIALLVVGLLSAGAGLMSFTAAEKEKNQSDAPLLPSKPLLQNVRITEEEDEEVAVPRVLRQPLIQTAGIEKAKQMRKALMEPTDKFKDGITNDSLQSAIEYLHKATGLNFRVDLGAFKAEGEQDILNKTVTVQPSLNVALGTVLRDLLTSLEPQQGGFLIRADHIEITSLQCAIIEDDNMLLTWATANVNFDNAQLSDAFRQIAKLMEGNILLDGRAEVRNRAATTITGEFKDVPISTIIRLIADQASLKPVRIENVIYVTTPENADLLDRQERRRHAGYYVPTLSPRLPRMAGGG